MIIAVDFDGTLFADGAYPGVGHPLRDNIRLVKRLQKMGHRLILWTCRDGEPLQCALDACAREGIRFVAVNENDPEHNWDGPQSRKIYADFYFDDRNIYGRREILNELCRKIKAGVK